MQDRLYEMLIKEDEITWQTIIYDLVKSEQMNPWDIDVSLLAQKYLQTVKKLQEMNFAVSGKIVLASAILLRIKSHRLVEEDLLRFEELINPSEEEFEGDLFGDVDLSQIEENRVVIIPKTPQPRKRKVSVEDLVDALQKALATSNRRSLRMLESRIAPEVKIPERTIDITQVIKDVYDRILLYFKSEKRLTFDKFIPSERREDKIATFVPLLHLDNQRKIDMEQKDHFGEIEIWLRKK